MDTEQLKLVIELLRGAGEGTRDVAIVWLLVPIIQTILNWLGGLILTATIGHFIVKGIGNSGKYYEAWLKVCSFAECRNNEDYMPNRNDIETVIRKLREQGAKRAGNNPES